MPHPVAVPTGRAGVQGSVGVCESVLCAEHRNIAVHNTENIMLRERQPNWDRARITPPPGQTTPEISCGKLFLVRRGSGLEPVVAGLRQRGFSCRVHTMSSKAALLLGMAEQFVYGKTLKTATQCKLLVNDGPRGSNTPCPVRRVQVRKSTNARMAHRRAF